MFARNLTISTLAGLLLFAAVRGASESAPQHGRLKVSINAASESLRESTLAGSLTIVGMDSPLRERVALADAADRPLDVSLPPGLYSLEWNVGSSAVDVARPDLHAMPHVIAVASDRVSSVDVHVIAAPVLPALSATELMLGALSSDATLALR